MAINFIGTGRAVPPKRVSNDDLAAQLDTSDEWIRSHTGIGNRHIADENITCSDLAAEAARNAMAMAAGYTGEDLTERNKAAAEIAPTIDMIVLATVTPDYFGTPSAACIVQEKIGAKNAAAMDIIAGCTGFVYGLETAAGLLSVNPQRKRALVIGAELLSKMINWDDRATCVLFGDGAGAALIEKTDGSGGLKHTLMSADGSGHESLLFRRGGTRYPFKKGEVIDTGICVEMNGQEVYNFAVKAVTDTIGALMKTKIDGYAEIKMDDITRIVPHQANLRIVQAAAKRLKIPFEKIYMNIEEYANTSSATIPIALDELNRSGEIKKGDLIFTVGFGGGLTYGGNIIIW
ncbi:MAG: ketoacyl-ACP synthase III [Treponema sp.]|nr:ketoacyl-ACP synthase III [Treponema sp.]